MRPRTQVLMATHLKRTESVVQPALFRFDEHFELQDLIGASRNSEVRLVDLFWTGQTPSGMSRMLKPAGDSICMFARVNTQPKKLAPLRPLSVTSSRGVHTGWTLNTRALRSLQPAGYKCQA